MNKLKLYILTFGISLAIILGQQAKAATLSFDPGAQIVGSGISATVDLRISGLGDHILTAFDLDILYDASILDFQSFTFGSGLDVLSFGTLNDVIDLGSGSIKVFELSLDSDEDLTNLQPNGFVLGIFSFDLSSTGTSPLQIIVNDLIGEFVYDPDLDRDVPLELEADTQPGSITIAAVPIPAVPVPAAVWLFATALAGFIGVSRRRKVA